MVLNNPQSKRISRRSMMLFGGTSSALMLLAGQMVNLQVFQSEDMRRRAEQNQVDWKVLLPKRGAIRDRTDQAIAESAIEYDLYLLTKLNRLNEDSLDRLLKIISRDQQEYLQLQD
jgi:cell division protein FtsI/penicillin-binding protein 2